MLLCRNFLRNGRMRFSHNGSSLGKVWKVCYPIDILQLSIIHYIERVRQQLSWRHRFFQVHFPIIGRHDFYALHAIQAARVQKYWLVCFQVLGPK